MAAPWTAGLYLMEVPYPLLFGATGAALRYIPYLGPFRRGGPADRGQPGGASRMGGPPRVAGFFLALELFTNMVLETVLYADAAGVSNVALLVAVAFWTWLWGPIGLLLSIPLTVCVVVRGPARAGARVLSRLMSDAPTATGPELHPARSVAS